MAVERLFQSIKATANSAGNATFTFPTPPTDLVWLGTLTCAAAPVAAVFTATVAGSQWCAWAGQSIGGPVQALPGEQVQVTATGLTASTTFVLQWIGRSDSYSTWVPSYPDTNSAPASVLAPGGGPILVEFLTGTPFFGQQKIATGGTAVQVTSANNPLTQGMVFEAMKANTDQVYIGLVGVTTTHDGTGNGWELQPGFVSPVLPFSNTNLAYFNSATTAQAISWAAF